jgi:tagatose-6-phosphate ketose/aldose isomerase
VLSPRQTAGDLVERLAVAAEQVLADSTVLTELAARRYERVVYLGSGPLAGLARESALKLLELTAGAVVSYFDTSLGFRHGPKAVLRPRTLAVLFRSNDEYSRCYDEDIADELRSALGAEHVLVVTAAASNEPAVGGGWQVAGLDDVEDAALALPFVVIAQTFALEVSLELGLTPDNPFPAGEVNRVVQGVTIHPLAP